MLAVEIAFEDAAPGNRTRPGKGETQRHRRMGLPQPPPGTNQSLHLRRRAVRGPCHRAGRVCLHRKDAIEPKQAEDGARLVAQADDADLAAVGAHSLEERDDDAHPELSISRRSTRSSVTSLRLEVTRSSITVLSSGAVTASSVPSILRTVSSPSSVRECFIFALRFPSCARSSPRPRPRCSFASRSWRVRMTSGSGSRPPRPCPRLRRVTGARRGGFASRATFPRRLGARPISLGERRHLVLGPDRVAFHHPEHVRGPA